MFYNELVGMQYWGFHLVSGHISVRDLLSQGLFTCLHGVGDPGLVGLVSFVFTLWGTQNKRNLPH